MKHVPVITAGVLGAALALGACEKPDPGIAQGYVEGEYVFVAARATGRIETLAVVEGARVEPGAVIATLDDVQAKAQLADAQATLQNAERDYKRQSGLTRGKVVSESAFDLATRAFLSAQANVAARAWELGERSVKAPVGGVVQDILFRPGEVVTAGQAIVKLLPPENRKVRFYVSEAALPRLAIGGPVTVRCDGCGGDIAARVSYISPQAEYTPPVIYSLETRAKLVFMIEAKPETLNVPLNVGQPVSVLLPAGTP